MKWFGKSWDAPCCGYMGHVATPVGQLCVQCDQPIAATDCGFMIPQLQDNHFKNRPWHRECFLQNVLGGQNARPN